MLSILENLRLTSMATLVAVVASWCFSPPVSGQRIPQLPPGVTPEQAVQMAQGDPQLGRLVVEQLRASGLSPDQVRARLRAAGYSSTLLDSFLADADTTVGPLLDPTAEAVEALTVLGLVQFSTRDSLLLSGDTLALRMYEDSLRADSIIQAELEDAPLSVFGIDVFRQPTTQFQPLVTGPVGPNYALGPGDELVLILTGDVELARSLPVTREGFILIPDVGQISVNSLTLPQLRTLLRTRLANSYSGIRTGTTTFDVTVSRIRTISLVVTGEVARPGTYQVAATASVLTVIYEAGGLTPLSNFRQVAVRRGRQLVGSIDLYDFLLTGQVPSEVRLQDGDVVFVPIRGPRVTVAGEVMRPAIYELRPGETLRDLLYAAGGLTAEAQLENATISRVIPPRERVRTGRARTVVTVDLSEALSDSSARVTMFDSDSVTVFSIKGPRTEAVSIAGAVWQPGTYQLRSGMRLSDLIRDAGGLRPETYAGRVQVMRLRPDSTRVMFGVALPDDGAAPAPGNDPLLQELDSVTVFSRTEFRPERQISVYGALQRPGAIVYSDSMTLRDAILLAGGLEDDAYLLQAEISRPRPDGTMQSDSLALVMTVPLDSTYLFDPTSRLPRATRANGSPDVLLEPYDNVFVRRQPGLELQRNVVITGEVMFPGTYTLISKQERLLELINRAGGLTRQAYPDGVGLFRLEGRAGRISADLPAIIDDPSHRDNVILAEGDSIHIPAYIPTVRVEGAVLSPSSVTYVPNAKTGYYVDAAGGFTEQADKGRTFVQQPNGLIQKRSKRPEPGAVVFVPEKDPDRQGVPFTVVVGGIAQVLSALTTIIILIQR